MDVIAKIYWIRVALGAIAGLLCTGAVLLFQSLDSSTTLVGLISSTNTLINGITIALFVYIVGYYVLKAKFASKVEKQSKIMSMGIFIYFFTWIVVWVLSISLLIGPV